MYLDLKLVRPCKLLNLYQFIDPIVMIEVTKETQKGILAFRLHLPSTRTKEEELMGSATRH